MNAGVWVVLAIVTASLAVSVWRKYSFSIVVSIACVLVYIVTYVAAPSGIMDSLGFSPHDLVDPGRAYTILTSMYTHANIEHLFLNLLGLLFIGVVFEQRIGTRPYLLLYLLTGLCGSLTFAALNWSQPGVIVVGASGAIFGILGGFTRLYPRERFMFPLVPVALPLWFMVVAYLLIQLLLIPTSPDIAVAAHIGGLVSGMLLAPWVVKLSGTSPRVRIVATPPALRGLATTPELRTMLDRIENETVPDVKRAWTEHFLSKARCPRCGSAVVVHGRTIICEKGHIL